MFTFIRIQEVSYASCSCVAGRGGCYKHVAALLFQILDFIQLELSEVPDDLTCTQLLQKTGLLFDSNKFSQATSTRKYKRHKVENINLAAYFAKKCDKMILENLKKDYIDSVDFVLDILYIHKLYSRAYSTRFATISIVNTLEKGLNKYKR